jgi:flavin reductase (DIM6/NTAB) family NADH-FMN oxidoreductase RutF
MIINPSELPGRKAHDILTSSIIPRPIAWVSSINLQGKVNLAPFSMFNLVAWSPPTLCFSVVNREDGSMKDTLTYIKETGNFVVNMVSESIASKMVATSAVVPHGTDKAQKEDVQLAPSSCVDAPRVREAKIAFECVLDRIVTVGGGANAGNLVLGNIKVMYVNDDILDTNGMVDCLKLQVVGRLGGTQYCTVHSVFNIQQK